MSLASKKGFIFEHEIAEKLKGQGFAHVKVTKASRDYGADILAFKDGLEYVVQCKKYRGTVGFNAVKDIATAMDIYQADRGILVCDTSFSKSAHKAVEMIDKPIELMGLEEIRSWKAQKIEHVNYRPFPYQKSILSKLDKHRKEGNHSALLVMATGLGKTLVAAWDLKNQIRKGKKALFLVHRKDILVDNAEKFHSVINEKKESFKFGIYFAGKKFKKEGDVVFSTFQTIIKHYKKIPKGYFDYIIIDEAHHSPAPSYAEVFSYFNPKFILGITATPKRITRTDNEFINTVFGSPLVNLDLTEALLKGYLSPVRYSVFCDNIDYAKLKSANRKLSIEQLNRTYFIPTKDEDIEKLVYKEMAKVSNPRAIIFCPSIKYINSVKSLGLFKDAEIYHSNMGDFKRSLIFRRFKIGKIKTILVVDLFNEGIDIPDANVVVFLRTTYSPTIFFQQLGRGLRKHKGKKYLRVLDFVGAISNIKKVINVFGHLLIIQDFVEKVEKQKKLSNIHKGKTYKDAGLLEPLELDFYQVAKKVRHKEALFRKRDFLSEVKFIKKQLKKSEGWTEEEICDALRFICKKLGHFPSQDYLEKIGRADLAVQVSRGGGVYYFADKLSYKTSQKKPYYWTSWTNLKSELLPICNKIGKMPTGRHLRNIGKADLESACYKWGGLTGVGKKLGYKTIQKPKKYWDINTIKKELRPYYKKLGRMPDSTYLKRAGKNDLLSAIQKMGGICNMAKKLKYKIRYKTKGYWDDFGNLRKELLPIVKKIGRMPSGAYLRSIDKKGLESAIYKWGGFYEVAKKLKYEVKQKPVGYWDKWANLRDEIVPICKKLGEMPSRAYLMSIGRHDLKHAIDRWGGVLKVKKKLKKEKF